MRRIVSATFVSLNGVMQGPGGPDEDPTGGFADGGWVAPWFDAAVAAAIGASFAPPPALLLGRKTYEIFAAHWPYATGEGKAMGEALTAADKYVLTRGGTALDTALDWANSHALAGIEDVARLKATPGPDLLIQGSSTLFAPLLAAGLLDEAKLLIFPVLLGAGKRAFGTGTPPASLRLIAHSTAPSGVIIATYRPDGPLRTGDFQLPEPSARELARRGRMAREG